MICKLMVLRVKGATVQNGTLSNAASGRDGENAMNFGLVREKAEVGFEPTNNGFAIRPLSPLGYSAREGKDYPLKPKPASRTLPLKARRPGRCIVRAFFRFGGGRIRTHETR